MKTLYFAIVAFVVINKLWASAETKWESFMNRIRIEPRSRTNPLRKGAPMRTQIMPTSLDPETVWGVEALDPLQQRAWAQALWQRWYHTAPPHRPLLLRYHPSAERAAMRALNTFARLSRGEECAPWVVLAESQNVPWLAPRVPALSLYLLHHASRIANMKAWLAEALAATACRVVMTAPHEETPLLGAVADFEIVEIPGEEADYCDAIAREIVAKPFSAGEPLSALDRIVIAAGCAGIALPMSLLARHLHYERATLCETLLHARLQAFVMFRQETNTVAFRGAWLARKLMAGQGVFTYETLLELVTAVDTESPSERNFLLQLVLAWRAQRTAEPWPKQHAEIFRQAQQCARVGEERQAWRHLFA